MNKAQAKKWIRDFLKRVETQDNRATAAPVQFLLQQQRLIYGQDLSNPNGRKYSLPHHDYYDYDSKEKLLAAMQENGYSEEEIEKLKREIVEQETTTVWETTQAFLTEEGLKRHVAMNRHNLGKFRDFVVPSFRNPEMRELFDALKTLDSEEHNCAIKSMLSRLKTMLREMWA